MTRGIPHLAAAAILLALSTRASANCTPPKSFSQIGMQYSQYVLLPENAVATPSTVIGRFWQPGMRVSTHEGTCDETKWLTRCYDCTPQHHGPVYFVDGVLGQMSCFSGCPVGEMIVLLQDRTPLAGGIFAAGRINELPGQFPRFDFSRIDKDWTLVPIPPPQVTRSEVEGTTLHLDLLFADAAAGYYSLEGRPPNETITALHVLTFEGISPPVDRAAWTSIARINFLGGVTAGSVDILSACPGSDETIRFIATAIELDSGQLLTDYVSAAVPVSCAAETPAGAGRMPEVGPGALALARSAAGELTLSWGASCAPSSPTYELYEGLLGEWTDPLPVTCGTTDSTLTIPEPQADMYYLVVPYANRVRPPQVEGSYGVRGDGSERPPSAAACRPQWIVPCP